MRFLAPHRDLWQAIGAVSGSDVLVDSSKAGPRAWILALDPAVRLVYLHRDPADVLASWRSSKFDPGLGGAMKRMSISAAAVDLWKVDRLLARLARSRTAAYVDYATLCTAPKDTLDELWATLGIPTRGSPDWLSSDTVRPAVPYHSLNGNPDRFGTVPIRISRRSAEWSKISRAERWGIHAAATAVRLTAPRASWRD